MRPYRYVSGFDTDFTPSARANAISLKELCGYVLVSRSVLSPTICPKLPQRFVKLLMQCAIKYSCKTSISSLLDAWRHDVFSIEMPVCMKRREAFLWQDVSLLSYKLKKEQRFVSYIVKHVIDLLTSDCESECQIRCLDFSSIPVKDTVLHSICKLLIEKCDMFQRCENDSPVKKRKRSSKQQNSLNEFVIKINVVHIERDFSLLSKTLTHLKNNDTALNLKISGIDFTGVRISMDILQLLDLIDPQTLDTFSYCLSFNPYAIPLDFELIQKLRNFPNLRILNFELEVYNLGLHGRIFLELSDLFRQLKNLKHLAINNFDSKRPIQISEFVTNQTFASKLSLEFLALRGFKIPADGLQKSSLFPQALALKTLSLTSSELDLQSLICLLTSCKNLLDLCLERCEFLGGNIDLLFQALPGMKELEHLSIRGIKMSSVDLMSKAGYISCMPNLKYLSISTACIFHGGIMCCDFQKRFRHAVEMLWNCPSRNLRCE